MEKTTNLLSTGKAFQTIGYSGLILGLLTIISSIIAYLPDHPEFSIFATYLSDIGATPDWPQIFFNTGTILSAPLRYLILLLLVLRLRAFGNSTKCFEFAVLVVGAFSTLGTILMTAVPYTVALVMHKTGIGFYFLGVVFLQSIIAAREIKLKELPRILPGLSFAIVVCFLIFLTFFILYETGNVGRSAPVIWEWLCAFSSLLWLLGHSIILGKDA